MADLGPNVGPAVGAFDGADVADGIAVEASRVATLSVTGPVEVWGLPHDTSSRTKKIKAVGRALGELENRQILKLLSQVIGGMRLSPGFRVRRVALNVNAGSALLYGTVYGAGTTSIGELAEFRRHHSLGRNADVDQ